MRQLGVGDLFILGLTRDRGQYKCAHRKAAKLFDRDNNPAVQRARLRDGQDCGTGRNTQTGRRNMADTSADTSATAPANASGGKISDNKSSDSMAALDPYVSVRALLIARKWDNASLPRSEWFPALARAGFTGMLAGGNGYTAGMANFLTAAEIFGAFALPLSFAPVAGAAAALAASDAPAAQAALQQMLDDGAPVLPALQSGAKTMVMGAGGGLTAQGSPHGGLSITGTRFAVPDAGEAQRFLAEAQGPDGIAVFLFSRDTPGVEYSSLTDATGGNLGAFRFENCAIAPADVLAQGAQAHDLLDRMRFAVQLGLGAELSGLGGALMARAGESHASDRDIAATLLDISLARAFVFGAAGIARPVEPGALEIIAGARAAASKAALAAAELVLGVRHDDRRTAIVERLVRRAIVASRIYRQPQAHKLRFVQWRWGEGAEASIFTQLFTAASRFAGGPDNAALSPQVADLIEANESVRKTAHDAGVAEDPVFRDSHGDAELALMALVCADAQHQAGNDVSAGFLSAARDRTARKIAAGALYAAGSHAALADHPGDIASRFIAANRCGTGA